MRKPSFGRALREYSWCAVVRCSRSVARHRSPATTPNECGVRCGGRIGAYLLQRRTVADRTGASSRTSSTTSERDVAAPVVPRSRSIHILSWRIVMRCHHWHRRRSWRRRDAVGRRRAPRPRQPRLRG